MVSFKNALILLSLMFLPGLLPAQHFVTTSSLNVHYRIPYLTRDAGDQGYENQLLREMAKEVLREPWLVRIIMNCELGFTIERRDHRDQLIILLRRPIITGDTVYRHFPVSDVLFPSSLSMKLRWANRADTTGYVEETLTGKVIAPADSVVCVIPVSPFDPEVDTLIAREIVFRYDSMALQEFIDRIGLIHDYYASLSLLDSVQQLTEDLSLEKKEMLPYNYLKEEELCRVVSQIGNRNFPGRLLVNGYDPSHLVDKYTRAYKHSKSVIYNFIDELYKTGAIPWDGDANRLAGYFTSRVLSFVRRSFLMDQLQGLIYRDCLDHLFDQSGFPPEENVVARMLAKMFPDAQQDTVARYISSRIYASYEYTARELMDQHRFAEASSMLENGRKFISGNPFLKGFEANNRLQAQAAEGIFNSYIGIASTCISSHKFNMAETYLSKAEQYALSNAGYIRSDSSYRAAFSELFFLRNADCDQLLSQDKYGEALDCYNEFEKAYSAHDLAFVRSQLDEKKSAARAGLEKSAVLLAQDAMTQRKSDTALYYFEKATSLRQEARMPESGNAKLDSLAPVMAKIKYGRIMEEGAVALEKRQYTLSVNRLNEARAIANSFKIDPDPDFDSLYRQAFKNWLIINLGASQKKIWANQFDSAELALQRTELAGSDQGLMTDPDFTAALERYRVKIREQKCRNLQDSVTLRMIRADRGIFLGNFIGASANLQEALAFIASAPGCGISGQPVRDSLEKYRQAAVYQHNLAEIRSQVAIGNYLVAVQELDNNEQLYRQNRLERVGLQSQGFYNFILERNNPYLTGSAISFYVDRKNYQEALKYLLLVKEQGMAPGDCAEWQTQLGRRLAQLDFVKDPKDEVLKNIGKYVPGDGWFNLFRTSYTTEWNRLIRLKP